MAQVTIVTEIPAPPQKVFDLARSIDLHVESMAKSGERAVAGVTSGLIELGEEVTWEARHFGIRWRVTSRITEFKSPTRFVDEMLRGPFEVFYHEHVFEPAGKGTRMIDTLEGRTRLGFLSVMADRLAAIYLRHLLLIRNEMIRTTAATLREGLPELY